VKRAVSALTVLVLAGLLSGCGSGQVKEPKIVATAYPLFEAAATIGGKHVHAVNLLPLDPYAAVPAKKADQLRNAALAVVLGGGAQPEVDKIIEQRTGPTLRILGEGDFHATVPDPNVWLDPTAMIRLSESITDELANVLPERAEAFRDNLAAYEGTLGQIDREYVKMFASCEERTFLVEKPEFSAFERRFGLRQVAVGRLSLDVVNDPAVRAVQEHEATTVFADELPPLDDAPKVRDRYGVRVAVLDPIDSQADQARRGGATYRSVMNINLDALRAALSCAPKEH
jgi:zinc transport system substrate-binding protein